MTKRTLALILGLLASSNIALSCGREDCGHGDKEKPTKEPKEKVVKEPKEPKEKASKQ